MALLAQVDTRVLFSGVEQHEDRPFAAADRGKGSSR
jgi:hypothetical protein